MIPRLPAKWRKPLRQANAIKGKKGQNRAHAVHLWCLMAKEALRGNPVSVRGVQPKPEPNLDESLGTEVRGEVGAEAEGSDSPRVSDPGETKAGR